MSVEQIKTSTITQADINPTNTKIVELNPSNTTISQTELKIINKIFSESENTTLAQE